MSNVVILETHTGSIATDLKNELLEREVLSLSKNIDTNLFLIKSLQDNIVNLKKEKVIVSLKEYKKILSELSYLNYNLIALKDVYNKNAKQLGLTKKAFSNTESKIIKFPKIKRKKSSKKDKT